MLINKKTIEIFLKDHDRTYFIDTFLAILSLIPFFYGIYLLKIDWPSELYYELYNSQQRAFAKIILYNGEVTQHPHGSPVWRKIHGVGEAVVNINDTIKTSKDSFARIILESGEDIELGPQSTIQMAPKNKEDKHELQVIEGTIKVKKLVTASINIKGLGQGNRGLLKISPKKNSQFEIRAIKDQPLRINMKSGATEVVYYNDTTQLNEGKKIKLDSDQIALLSTDGNLNSQSKTVPTISPVINQDKAKNIKRYFLFPNEREEIKIKTKDISEKSKK